MLFFCPICAVFGVESLHGADGFQINVIDASKNAVFHNSLGNVFFDEKNYGSAITEYETAYNLAPNSNMAGVYLFNLAKCYKLMNKYDYAKKAILGAISKDCINLTYYEALVDCYFALNTQKQEFEKHIKDETNPYNRIIAGLIYLKSGDKVTAKMIFDDFITHYPDMQITNDIKLIIDTL